tara:strand:+ start:826 stop:1929 length:1104 start_codon:yes stop_codon:yes gene_type:complete
MSAPTPRSGIIDISPYKGGESELEGQNDVIKLSSNENAFGPSPLAEAAYAQAASKLHLYPDGSYKRLREAIAKLHGLKPDRIICGAGSDEIISLLCLAYAGPGDEVLYSQHGFLMYPISAKAVGAKPVFAKETDLTSDVDALLEKVNSSTRLLFLANPNNPTGTYLTEKKLRVLRQELPENIILVIDAAYAEYATRTDYSPGIDLVENYENVVMTRTFSKIYGLGGIRLGWAYCPKIITDILNRVRGPFNVSSPAIEAGIAALSDSNFINKTRTHNDTWLAWTYKEIIKLGLKAPKSAGNFILIQFPSGVDKSENMAESANVFLKNRGIIVRRMLAYGLPDCLRVSIGRENEMKTTIGALKEFIEKS